MKDFLNFDIGREVKPDGQVIYTLLHKKRKDLSMTFKSSRTVRSEDLPDLIRGLFKAYVAKYMKATRVPLSPKQKKFYDMVVWFHKTEGRPPSHEECCDVMGWKSKGTSFYYTKRLQALGWFWTDEDGRVIPVDIAAPELTE